jgi:DNA-binding winged helix-turn-helix (wHTH) protein/TolB-like protein/Tfp pilus assembly protein PilF
MQPRQGYEFGEFILDEAERCLLRKGQPVSLTPKAFETLLVLVRRGGHVVEKDEMLKEVWPDTFVEEATLAQNIFTLRKALGQGRDGDLYIETVPKRGYRFVADVKALDSNGTEVVLEQHTRAQILIEEEEYEEESPSETAEKNIKPQALAVTYSRQRLSRYLLIGLVVLVCTGLLFYIWRSRTARQRGTDLVVKSIAVLPFKPLDADSGNELLGLGMADAIIIRLSNFQSLPVLPTSTIIKYAGRENNPQALGQALGVDAVLDGTVQRSGDRVRVTVQLISIGSGTTLWSDKFDEQFTNIFAVQDSLSERVAQGLARRIAGGEKTQRAKRQTENQEAYQAYVMGLYFYNKRTKDGMGKAVEYFQQAINEDPNYALAYAMLADSYYLTVYYNFNTGSSKETFEKALAAANKAIELDETVGEAHTALATILSDYTNDRKAVEREHKRAIELNPNYAMAHLRYGWFLFYNGQLDESVREMRRAQELDPLSPTTNGALAGALFFIRQYDESMKYSKQALELDPNSFINRLNLGDTYEAKGMYDQAIAEYQKARELNSASWDPLASLGHVYAVAGRKAEAEEMLTKLEATAKQDKRALYGVALIYAGLNDKDKAFEWLERALEGRAVSIRNLRYDPDLDVLKADPRFDDLLRRFDLMGMVKGVE